MNQAITTLPQLTESEKRMLWLLFRYGHLLRPSELQALAKLEGLAAVVRDVLAAGQTAVRTETDPVVASIIDDIFREPRCTSHQLRWRRELAGEIENDVLPVTDLARSLFRDETAVMVAPISYFTGSYPQPKHKRACETYWVAAGEGNRVKGFAPVCFSLWRSYQTKGGEIVPACPHCQHERVFDFCQKIERASELYTYSLTMRYTILPATEATKLMGAIKKRNQRGATINAVTFPLEGGKTAVLHDADHVEGHELPHDRAALYELVKGWVLSTPKGKRAGHGLGTWGRVGVEETEQETNQETKQPKVKDKMTGKRWRLIGRNFGQVAMKIGAWLGEDITPKGAKLNLDAAEFIQFLEDAGIDYATDGDVPISVCNHFKRYTKGDRGQAPPLLDAGDTPQRELELLFGGGS